MQRPVPRGTHYIAASNAVRHSLQCCASSTRKLGSSGLILCESALRPHIYIYMPVQRRMYDIKAEQRDNYFVRSYPDA